MIRRYEYDGQVWLISQRREARHNGVACRSYDLKGDVNALFGHGSVVFDSLPLGNRWTRYWLIYKDPALQALVAETVEVLEAIAARQLLP